MKTLRVLLAVVVVFASFAFVPVPKSVEAVVGWVGAGGSPYVGSANPQPLDINVSRDNNDSTNRWDRYFQLDSSNYPHVVWTDRSNSNINYVYWNGNNWLVAGGAIYNSALSNSKINLSAAGDVPQLALDSKNRPHIVWHVGSWPNIDIFYICWNGVSWVNANSVLFNGVNGNVSNDSDSSTDPVLEIDSKDLPHIAWFNDSDREIYYIRFNGSNWVVQDNSIYNPATGNANISRNAGESNYPQIDLDSADIPGIAWGDDSGGNLDTYFVKLYPNQTYTANGSIYNGTNANVSNDSFSGGQGAEIKFDKQNKPWILWHANGDVYCVNWNGTAWVTINGSLYVPNSGNANITQNSGSSDCSTITFDASNYPHFTWHDTTYGNQEICYMKWNGTAFVNANNAVYSPTTGNVNVSNNTGSSYNPHLVLDDSGLPHLLWTDNTIGNNEIYYAHFSNSYDGSFTLTKSVDTNNDGDYNDSGKQVNVGDTLKYKINWKFNQGQDPLEEPYLYDTIPEGTHYVAGTASPNANLSYSLDGGATWIAGEPPNGSPAGTQLRWDLSSLWVGAAGSPYIGSAATQPTDINVSYSLNNLEQSVLPDLAIDSSGNPCITWTESGVGIMYARWNGSNWLNSAGLMKSSTNCAIPNAVGTYPILVLDKSNRPRISYMGYNTLSGTPDVFYVSWNGTNWVNANNDIFSTLNGFVNNTPKDFINKINLVLDKSENPCISWVEFTLGVGYSDICFTRWDGNSWVNASNALLTATNCYVSVNAGKSLNPSLALDKNNMPCIAWEEKRMDGSGDEIYFAKWNGTNWVNAVGSILNSTNGNVSNNTGTSWNPSLALDSSDYPCIAWRDFTPGNSEIYFSKWDGTSWANANGAILTDINGNVSKNPGDSSMPSLVFDSSGNPCIDWLDQTSGGREIYFARYINPNWVNINGSLLSPRNPFLKSSHRDFLWAAGVPFAMTYDLAINFEGTPFIAWDLDISGGGFNSEIFFVKLSKQMPFTFSVQVDNPPATPAFCNEAIFRHKWDNGKATTSNSVCNTIDYNFTGKFELKKSVETTGDSKYDDDGKEAKAGDKLNYKIDWSFDNPNSDPLFDAYVYDTIPEGTTYVAGSATSDMLSYSTDGGTTWIAGEPPDGAPAGTRLRWGLIRPYWANVYNEPLDPVTDNSVVSKTATEPSIAFSKNGKPGIAFSDYSRSLIDFDILNVLFDGSRWIGANGLPYDQTTASNAGVSVLPTNCDGASLAYDSNGYPCVAWGEKTDPLVLQSWEIYFARWNGTSWVTAQGQPFTGSNANVSNTVSTSYGVSLAIDSNDNPHLAWYDYQGPALSFEIVYINWNGSDWVNASGVPYNVSNSYVSNTTSSSEFPVLRLGSNDQPYIAWSEGLFGGYDVLLVKWNGTQWVGANDLPYNPSTGVNANVSRNAGYSSYPSLDVDDFGNPAVAWHDFTYSSMTSTLCVRWEAGQWVGGNGLPYITATGANGIVASSLFIPDGATANPLGAKLASVRFNLQNQMNLAWWGNIPGAKGIYFAKSNGKGWFSVDWSVISPTNASKAYTLAGSKSVYTNYSYALAMDLDDKGNPYITYLTQTSANYIVSVIKHVPTSQPRSYTFSVKITDPFIDDTKSPICNKAEFWHVFDKGNHTKSNSVCNNVYKKPEDTKKAKLKITKKAFKYTLGPKDVVHFAVEIENIGDVDAIDVNIYDYFPKELEIYHSIPKGEIGGSSIRYFLELLKAGHKRRFEVMFKVSKSAKIGKDGLYLTNIAKAFSKNSESAVEASATVVIRNDTPSGSVSMNLQMMGVDAKTGVCKKGTEISIKVDPDGGTPPYDIVVDWGDGTQSKAFNVTTDKPPTLTHTYNEAGEYTITIICTDQYGNVCKIIRKVEVE